MDMNRLRDHMVEHHVVRRGIRDENVTRAMRVVPREKFVDPGLRNSPMRTPLCRSARVRRSRSHSSSL